MRPLLFLILLALLLGAGAPDAAEPGTGATSTGVGGGALVRLQAVPFTKVSVADRFWAPRRATNRLTSIAVNLENLEKAGNLENLRLAGRRATRGYEGPVFMDSDVYKALEAAAYSLATDPDPALDAKVDEIIAVLGQAQHPDGYLNSYYTVKEPGVRWVNLRDNHELYCAGHLFEAAVAHFQATGKTNFLRVARRFADQIDSVFGPTPKRMGYPGHPEIELALVKLAQATGERRYFELARFFVENRGIGFFAEEHRTPRERYDGSYWQDDVPIVEHRNIKGHAVRAAYLLSGATDIAGERGDEALLRMIRRVWRNTTERNLYLTGGIGPSAHNEGFTEDYDLPNRTAYQETCASVALAQWNHRLALLWADAKYADVVERSLYNGVLAGVSLDGRRFFYVNPLESSGGHHRSPWFGCACCPPNVARTLASLGGYAYATGPGNALYINLYLAGTVQVPLADGRVARVRVATDYPWDGRVRLTLATDGQAVTGSLHLRIPGWADRDAVRLDGEPLGPNALVERGYLVLDGTWQPGESIELDLPMTPRWMEAHPAVMADRGRVALQRGPLVYCFEAVDQAVDLDEVFIADPGTLPTSEWRAEMLGGVRAIRVKAAVAARRDWNRELYRASGPVRGVELLAVPYYAWDNRAAGAMKVWLPTTPPPGRWGGPEAKAKVGLSYTSGNCAPEAVNDGKEPRGSREHPGALCHFWPHKGGEEWVQYRWETPVRVGGVQVYWFDDTGVGECRLPGSWEVQYLDKDEWRPVKARDRYGIELDRWCTVGFEPVETLAMRLKMGLREGWAAGLHEWRVLEAED